MAAQGPFKYTISVTIEDIPETVEPHEVAAAALLGIALSDKGNPFGYLHRPEAVSYEYPAEGSAYGGSEGVLLITLTILGDYRDLRPVAVGNVPGHIKDMEVVFVI
jgi:hypothetical protein